MRYARKEFGARLKGQLSVDYDVVKLARWGHQEFLDHCKDLKAGIQAEMMKIIAMDEEIGINDQVLLMDATADGGHAADDVVDVIGSRLSVTDCCFAHIDTIQRRYVASGEYLRGRYFRAADLEDRSPAVEQRGN